ncbi:MAG: ATP-binding response regulator [Terriglobales bacterium]
MPTILTVDDNDALRYSLTRTLRGEGYTVIEARSGAEALRLATQSPDLITLDLNLPDVDGFEVCRLLRANPQTAHIPILHISATFIEPKHRVRGLEGGADAFLAEPITGAELLATVNALLRMKQAEREARLHASEAEKARQELRDAHNELEKRVRERTAELAHKNEEVRELTGRLLRSQDDERRRLARELHDSTGQILAAMKINLGFISAESNGRNQKIETLVAENAGMTDEITRQLRTMSYLLHPPLLDENGIQSALRWYAEGFAQRSGIQVELEIGPEFPRLPSDLEIAIFRVVQESLTNIHRHSGSTTATIRLTTDEEKIRLEIVDAGKGRPDTGAPDSQFMPGVGIMGMQERIRQFGGTFDITPEGEGTTVVATVPVRRSFREAG